METLFTSLSVALVSGITWIAWKEPEHRFVPIYLTLLVLVVLGGGLALVRDIGVRDGLGLAANVVEDPRLGIQVLKSGDGRYWLDGQRFLLWIGTLLYLGLLRALVGLGIMGGHARGDGEGPKEKN